MLIKLLTEARKGRENSSAKRDTEARRVFTEARRAETTPAGGRVLTANNLHNKRRYVYLSVCLLPMAGQTAGPIKTKLGIGPRVDPGSVLVKVKAILRHLANANKTPYRGPQGPREFEREAR